jgi:hypothetical protein
MAFSSRPSDLRACLVLHRTPIPERAERDQVRDKKQKSLLVHTVFQREGKNSEEPRTFPSKDRPGKSTQRYTPRASLTYGRIVIQYYRGTKYCIPPFSFDACPYLVAFRLEGPNLDAKPSCPAVICILPSCRTIVLPFF